MRGWFGRVGTGAGAGVGVGVVVGWVGGFVAMVKISGGVLLERDESRA